MSTFGGKENVSGLLTFFLLVITFMQRNVILSVSGLSIILQIMSEYKVIVLQKGLEDEAVDEYQFRKIKSLLRKELKLTKKMQDDYDKIQIADLMEDKFPKDAGLDKLIELCQSIKELEDLAQRLKTEKAKVESQKEGQNETVVEKEKDEEPSSSLSLSTNNELSKHKPSSEKKRKQTIKPEGGKKKKLTEKQIWLSEPSGSNREIDEGCLQTPHKPSPTPSSSSSSKKRKNTSNVSTIETETIQKKHKLLEFSKTSNTSAVSQLQEPLVLSATISSNVPCMPSEAVSGSVQAPQMSPASVSSCAQNILQQTPVAFSSMQALHSPQVPAFRSDQATRKLSVILKSKTQVRMMPPATASINIQIPHALPEAVPRNDCSIQKPQTATSSGIQTLNSATVKAPTNPKVPGLLKTGSPYFLACLSSPATASSSLQASQVLLPTTSNTHPAPQVSIPIATSSVQTTQTHPGAASNFIQVFHAPSLTESRSVYTTQVPQGVASSIGQALPCPKVKASTSVHAPQKPSATASKGLPAPCASQPTISSSLLDSQVCPATAFRALQVPLMSLASTSTSPSGSSIPEGKSLNPDSVMKTSVKPYF